MDLQFHKSQSPFSDYRGCSCKQFFAKGDEADESVAFHSYSFCVNVLRVEHSDVFKSSDTGFIDIATNKQAIKTAQLYMYHPSGPAGWTQSDVLSAELAGNFQVQNGDFKEFLER